MDGGGPLKAVNPPAAFLQLIGHRINIEVWVGGRIGKDAHGRPAQYTQTVNRSDSSGQPSGRLHNGTGDLQVAVHADGVQGSPSGGDGSAGPCTQQGRRGKYAAGPVFVNKELVHQIVHRTVKQN